MDEKVGLGDQSPGEFVFLDQGMDFLMKKYLEGDENLNKEEKHIALENVSYFDLKLFRVYEKNSKNKFEIPDHLCCKISFDLMQDPYITPAGNTYEGELLLEHVKKNGVFDPITRL